MLDYLKALTGFNGIAANEDGATAIEYGLIAGLIAIVIIGAITALGTNLSTLFQGTADAISAATPAS